MALIIQYLLFYRSWSWNILNSSWVEFYNPNVKMKHLVRHVMGAVAYYMRTEAWKRLSDLANFNC